MICPRCKSRDIARWKNGAGWCNKCTYVGPIRHFGDKDTRAARLEAILGWCLTGEYKCKFCRSKKSRSIAAAIDSEGEYDPVCEKHGQEAEQAGQRVIWKRP